jgi:hypothetical protein
MTHTLVHAITSKFQIIQIGTTIPRTDQKKQASCMSGSDITFGLPDGQPDANHVDQMLFCQTEPEVTYNAIQMVKITSTRRQHSKHIRPLIETTVIPYQETEDQVFLIGLSKISPIPLEDAQEQLIAPTGDTKVKSHTQDRSR